MATIFYPDGQEEEVQPANDGVFSLEEMQRIVQGYIEIYPLKDGRIMVLNEEGRILGLDRNEKATELAHFPTPEERNKALEALRAEGVIVINTMGADEESYIAGTVLVCDDSEVD